MTSATAGTTTSGIDIVAKYFLTPAGERYCNQCRIPVKDLKTSAGDRATGFEWSRCKVDVLRKLVIYGLLTSIEITRFEFVSKRLPLIGLTRTMLTGILLKRFRSHLKLGLRKHAAMASLLRDPSLEAMVGDRSTLLAALAEREPWVSALRAAIEADCSAAFAAAPLGSAEEEEERTRGMTDLVDSIDEETWLLLALAGPDLVGTVSGMIKAYVGRLGIAEALTLMLMEFVQYAERSHLLNMAERDRYVRAHPEELDRMLGEADFREKLLERAVEKGELIVIGIRFAGTVLDPSAPTTVEITVKNRGLIGYSSRVETASRRVKMVKEHSLDQILKEQERDDPGAGVSLLYLSNLAEACEAQGIAFRTAVQRDEFKDETVTTMGVSI